MQKYQEILDKYNSQLTIPRGCYLGVNHDFTTLYLFNAGKTVIGEYPMSKSVNEIQDLINAM
jgi:hypothetical protein